MLFPPLLGDILGRDAARLAAKVLSADEIAKFLYGPNGNRRKVYYLAACTRIPVFRLGTKLCARRSVLLNWIAGQENRALFRSSVGAMARPEAETCSADRKDQRRLSCIPAAPLSPP
jgi:hypothetical protein